jgi:hypothetical protein
MFINKLFLYKSRRLEMDYGINTSQKIKKITQTRVFFGIIYFKEEVDFYESTEEEEKSK